LPWVVYQVNVGMPSPTFFAFVPIRTLAQHGYCETRSSEATHFDDAGVVSALWLADEVEPQELMLQNQANLGAGLDVYREGKWRHRGRVYQDAVAVRLSNLRTALKSGRIPG
jgi:hypothetical protein